MEPETSNNFLLKSLMGTNRLLQRLEFFLLIIAGLSVFIIMVMTTLDVVFRYGFQSPIKWWFDVVSNYLLISTFFLAFSYTLAHHGHLAIDFFAIKFPRRFLHVSLTVSYFAVGVLLWIVTIETALDAFDAWKKGDVFAGAILWPVWVAKLIPPLGMLPLALRCFYLSFGHALCLMDPLCEKPLGISAIPLVIEGERA